MVAIITNCSHAILLQVLHIFVYFNVLFLIYGLATSTFISFPFYSYLLNNGTYLIVWVGYN